MGMPVAKKCEVCSNPVYFETVAGYNYHIKEEHGADLELYIGNGYKCNICTEYFPTHDELTRHKTTDHP